MGVQKKRRAELALTKRASGDKPLRVISAVAGAALPTRGLGDVTNLAQVLRHQAKLLLQWAEALERGQLATAAPRGAPGPDVEHRARITALFRREGEYWNVAYAGKDARLRHRVGLEYIRRLLESPGKAFPVLVLGGGASELAARPVRLANSRAQLHASPQELREVLDALESELAEAERNNDVGRAATIRCKRTLVLESVMGRGESVPAAVERARVALAKAVRRAVNAIRQVHPELAVHLHRKLRLGYSCRYDVDPDEAPRWIVA